METRDPDAGARNLLLNCAEAQRGERVLLAIEPEHFGYYRTDAAACIERVAGELGLKVEKLDVGFSAGTPHLSEDLRRRIDRSDIVIFLARLGDQLRFSEMPLGKRIVVSYALEAELLGSAFGRVHSNAMSELKSVLNRAFAEARTVRVSCRNGTEFSGAPTLPNGLGADVSVRRFPLSVFPPIPASTFRGRIALCGFLTGTGSRYYETYTIEFSTTLFAHFEDGRLTGFEGTPADVRAAEAQYDRIASTFGIERDVVHSWHAGIHPGCGYPWPARDDYRRWGGVSFGNPRLLHVHTCGTYAPGEISWNMVDPTIFVDEVPVWEDGVLHPDRVAGGLAILEAYPCAAAAFARPDRRIGL